MPNMYSISELDWSWVPGLVVEDDVVDDVVVGAAVVDVVDGVDVEVVVEVVRLVVEVVGVVVDVVVVMERTVKSMNLLSPPYVASARYRPALSGMNEGSSFRSPMSRLPLHMVQDDEKLVLTFFHVLFSSFMRSVNEPPMNPASWTSRWKVMVSFISISVLSEVRLMVTACDETARAISAENKNKWPFLILSCREAHVKQERPTHQHH